MKRKGLGMSLKRIIVIILFLFLALAVVPMITSGAESASRAATSCPDWISKMSDIAGGVDFC